MTSQSKIKIIHIIPTLDMGGAERLVVDIIKNLDKEKFSSEIICLKRFGWWGIELKKENIALTLLKQRHGLNFFVLFKLAKILRAKKPDIVHTHLFGADFYGGLAAWLAGVLCIISTEHNLNYNEGVIKKLFKRSIYKRITKVVAVSEAVRGYLEKQGINKNKIIVINNGVDISKYRSKCDKTLNEITVIGSAGRLTEQKGFDILIEAMAKINNGVQCVIAGEGELSGKLKSKIGQLKLTDKVKLTGRQTDMVVFFAGLDIFVLPSRWEGFGLVVLEAGLSGLPVIAANVDGIKEIIDDGINGLLFTKENVDELAEKIRALCADADLRTKLTTNLREKVIKEFSLEKMVGKYEKLYLDDKKQTRDDSTKS